MKLYFKSYFLFYIIYFLTITNVVSIDFPTSVPSQEPTNQPSFFPSSQPSDIPTIKPSMRPSQPSSQPSMKPSQPSSQPSIKPSKHPSTKPISIPSSQPNEHPSINPSELPSGRPSRQPFANPTNQPTSQPDHSPSAKPSIYPYSRPSYQPFHSPTDQPSLQPYNRPSSQPFYYPSCQPTAQPIMNPSSQPFESPSSRPSLQPFSHPSGKPTVEPSSRPTLQPFNFPTCQPSQTPSLQPSQQPNKHPSSKPSIRPHSYPSKKPVMVPSDQPSCQPVHHPTSQPVMRPFSQPSSQPFTHPTNQPSKQPFSFPSKQPARFPTRSPSLQPSSSPTIQPIARPSMRPSLQPAMSPSFIPTLQPLSKPSRIPTSQPTHLPTRQPLSSPTLLPTFQPTAQPSLQPLYKPSQSPSAQPSIQPSLFPRGHPSSQPSKVPSRRPSSQPSMNPTFQPSNKPSIVPSQQPSAQPSKMPSSQPTYEPFNSPTSLPSILPLSKPTRQPLNIPTSQPSREPFQKPSSQPSGNPSNQPTLQPVFVPSIQPTKQPFSNPTGQPSRFPSNQPSVNPNSYPTDQPSFQPSSIPTRLPSLQPSLKPTRQPSSQPVVVPTIQSSSQPITKPSYQPFNKPSVKPSRQPSSQPSTSPSRIPTSQPSRQPKSSPSIQPTLEPSEQPSKQPSCVPTMQPTNQPILRPSMQPSRQPFQKPTSQPSKTPSRQPTTQPSRQPSSQPTKRPTSQPSVHPSTQPWLRPSCQPSQIPTDQPTGQPSRIPSGQPTVQPRVKPSSQPTFMPSMQPSKQPFQCPSIKPTLQPLMIPSEQPSDQPSMIPSLQPYSSPSVTPTILPTIQPSLQPFSRPSRNPTRQPSRNPTKQPSSQPSKVPSSQPTKQPLKKPSTQPTRNPTFQPVIKPSTSPSRNPTQQPTFNPTSHPSRQPFHKPSSQPSLQPFDLPSSQPTQIPSNQPSKQPFSKPSQQPSSQPTKSPTRNPSRQPSTIPTDQPSSQPSRLPSSQPSHVPSIQPNTIPSKQPSLTPTSQPSLQPFSYPSMQPTVQPFSYPSMQPSDQPTKQPSEQPNSIPSKQPSLTPTSIPSLQPFMQPSLQPTSQPSKQPSVNPSLGPSGQPSVRPTSSRPTSKPTGSPSKFPISSTPTTRKQLKDSRSPSRNPTSHPTMNLNYKESPIYRDFIRIDKSERKVMNSFTFGNFYFKGNNIEGTCKDWVSYLRNNLNVPFKNIFFSSIATNFGYYDYSKKVHSNYTTTCSDRSVINDILDNLQNGGTYEGNCDGNTWRVFTCNRQRVFCVNCKRTCLTTVVCPGKSFVYNPCYYNQKCDAHIGAFAIANFQYTIIKLYPIFTAPLEISSHQNSVIISAKLDKPGNIFCNAFLSGVVPNSIFEIKNNAVSKSFFSPSKISLEISGLAPDANYDIYCVTDNFNSFIMTLEDSLATKTSAKTLCCRYFEFTKKYSIISQYAGGMNFPESEFVFHLSSPPTSSIIVHITALQVNCYGSSLSSASLSAAKVLPASFQFQQDSNLFRTFVIRSSVTGCFNINSTYEGYDHYINANATTFIQNSRLPLLPPKLLLATFSSDGMTIIIIFDSETNSLSSAPFKCSQMFHFIGSINCTCVWKDSYQVIANVTSVISSYIVGSSITLTPNKVKGKCVQGIDCSTYPYSPSMSLTFTAPKNPLPPVLSLSTTSYISSCDNLVLDPTGSIGAGGLPWKRIEWSVLNSISNLHIFDIEGYLNNNYLTTTEIIIIPKNYINNLIKFDIILSVTNFLMQSSVIKRSIEVVQATPQLRISGPSGVIDTTKVFVFEAILSFPTCSKIFVTSRLNYTWKVYNDLTYDGSILSKNSDPRIFFIQPNQLKSASIYNIEVSVALYSATNLNPVFSYDLISFVVLKHGIIASISGGLNRTQNNMETLTLDASSSYDSDDIQSSLSLRYEWECSVVYIDFGASCGNFSASIGPILIIPGGFFDVGIYVFRVKVSNSIGEYSIASTKINIVAAVLPTLYIDNVISRYNIDDKIILTGLISGSLETFYASWISPNITGYIKSKVFMTIDAKNFSSGTHLFQLALNPAYLQPELYYCFQLKANYVSNPTSISLSSILFSINAPPKNGALIIEPNRGQALVTSFSFSSYGWIDLVSDYPLNYVFSYFNLIASDQIVLKTRTQYPFLQTYLSAGLKERNYQVSGVIVVSDNFGASANLTESIMVTQPPGFFDAVSISSSNLVSASLLNDFNKMNNIISSSLETMNTVNCNVPKSCYLINRNACRDIPYTCGACVDGYIGVDGDSNIPCLKPEDVVGLGDNCKSSKKCITNNCVNGICLDVQKLCPNNCSNVGVCTYVDQNNDRIDNCLISNSSCLAVCSCSASYYGSDCSIVSASKFSTLINFKGYLFQSAAYIFGNNSDLSADMVASRTRILSKVLVDSAQISANISANSVNILLDIVNSNLMTSCDDICFNIVLYALSTALNNKNHLTDHIVDNISNTIAALGTSCQRKFAVGEKQLQYNSNNFKISNILIDPTNYSSIINIPLPQSPYEKLSKIPLSTINVGFDEQFNSYVGLSVVSIHGFVYYKRSHTNVVKIANILYHNPPSTYSAASMTWRSFLDSSINNFNYEVLLLDPSPINYVNYNQEFAYAICDKISLVSYVITASCGIQQINVTCPVSTKSLFNVTCPGYSITPQCTSWNDSQVVANSNCYVKTYTPSNVTCVCGSSSRKSVMTRRKLNAESLEISITEISSNIRLQYFPTNKVVYVYPLPKIYKNGSIVIITIYVVVGLYVILFLVNYLQQLSNFRTHKNKNRIKDYNAETSSNRTILGFYDSILPEELRIDRWFVMFCKRLKQEHDLTVAMISSENNGTRKIIYLVRSLWKVLLILILNSIGAYFIYRDKGQCDTLNDINSCESIVDITKMINLCQWNTNTISCEYNISIISLINIEIGSIIILIATRILVYMTDPYFEYIIKICDKLFVVSNRSLIYPMSITSEIQSQHKQMKMDEFDIIQSRKLTFMRAAKLEKLCNLIDYSSIADETALISEILRCHKFKSIENTVGVKNLRFGVKTTTSHKKIFKKLLKSRNHSVKLKSIIEKVETDFRKEEILMKYFIISNLNNFEQIAAKRYLFKNQPVGEKKDSTKYSKFHAFILIWNFFLILLIPMIMGSTAYFTYFFGNGIGHTPSLLWLIISAIAIIENLVILEPLIIWFKWFVLYYSTCEKCSLICDFLIERSRLILIRSFGLVTDTSHLIQHFNPVCRVARSYAYLPIGRLIMSFNDFDVPMKKTNSSHFGYLLSSINSFFRISLYLPEKLNELLFVIILITSLNVIIIYLSILGSYFNSIYIPIGVCVGIFMIIICIHLLLERSIAIKNKEINDFKNKVMFRKSEDINFMSKKKTSFKAIETFEEIENIYVNNNEEKYIKDKNEIDIVANNNAINGFIINDTIDLDKNNIMGPPIASSDRALFHHSKINYENKQQNNVDAENINIEKLKVDEFHNILQYTQLEYEEMKSREKYLVDAEDNLNKIVDSFKFVSSEKYVQGPPISSAVQLVVGNPIPYNLDNNVYSDDNNNNYFNEKSIISNEYDLKINYNIRDLDKDDDDMDSIYSLHHLSKSTHNLNQHSSMNIIKANTDSIRKSKSSLRYQNKPIFKETPVVSHGTPTSPTKTKIPKFLFRKQSNRNSRKNNNSAMNISSGPGNSNIDDFDNNNNSNSNNNNNFKIKTPSVVMATGPGGYIDHSDKFDPREQLYKKINKVSNSDNNNLVIQFSENKNKYILKSEKKIINNNGISSNLGPGGILHQDEKSNKKSSDRSEYPMFQF